MIFPTDLTKDFLLYVSASTYAVAGVLIQETKDQHEHAISYISESLIGLSINYNHNEKLALVVVLSY